MVELCAILAHKDSVGLWENFAPSEALGPSGLFSQPAGVREYRYVPTLVVRGFELSARGVGRARVFGGPRPWVSEGPSFLRERPEDTQRFFLFVFLSAVSGKTPPRADLRIT